MRLSQLAVASIAAVTLSCTSERVTAPAVPISAELARATALAAKKEKRLEQALAAATEAVTLAPEWPEAYFVRGGIHIAVAEELDEAIRNRAGGTWRIHYKHDPGTSILKLLADGAANWAGDRATWKPTQNGFTVRTITTSDGTRYDDRIAARTAGSRLSGTEIVTTTTLATGAVETNDYEITGVWISGSKSDLGMIDPGMMDRRADSLRSARADLSRYLELSPAAGDRQTVIEALGVLQVSESVARESATKLKPEEATTATPPE